MHYLNPVDNALLSKLDQSKNKNLIAFIVLAIGIDRKLVC